MTRTPVLHLLAGPNGAGKSTFVDRVLQPTTNLAFVNADVIAAYTWPTDPLGHAYEAARLADEEREHLLAARRSFITETVFSHPSKIDLVRQAVESGYDVSLHVILVPIDVSVRRVPERVRRGGHDVPETKIRGRYERLWAHVARARELANRTNMYDNSSAEKPFQLVAVYERGRLVGSPQWPDWVPTDLVS